MAGLGAILVVVGRMLGIWELFVVGTAALALVIMASLSVGLSRLKVNVSRQVMPIRLHVGQPARVDMRVSNLGRRSPVLRVRDPVGSTRGADISVGPLLAGETVAAAYRLPTDRRGAVQIGPMTIEVSDPFSLAKISAKAAAVANVTIFPAIHEISPAPFTIGNDPHGGAHAPNAMARSGDDFYALRQYTVGDDLRRVHWRSTARHGELMVRQHELPWQGRVTVMLDTRHEGPRESDFELNVSVAASVLAASARRHDLTRLVTTDGGDSDFAGGHVHLDALLEFLATVRVTGRGGVKLGLSKLHQHRSGGALVALLVKPTTTDIESIARMRHSFGSIAVVAIGESPDQQSTETVARSTPGTTILHVNNPAEFQTAWNLAYGRRGSLTGTVR
jgi:uncharacterized protein (DUF58 family)